MATIMKKTLVWFRDHIIVKNFDNGEAHSPPGYDCSNISNLR